MADHDELLLVPIDDHVVLPNMSITLQLDDVSDGQLVLLVPEGTSGPADMGVVAEVAERIRLPRRAGNAVVLNALHRGRPGRARTGADGRLYTPVEQLHDETPPPAKTRALETEYRAVAEEILELRGADSRVGAFLRSVTTAGALADTAGYAPDLSADQKIQLLETVPVVERLQLAVTLQRERLMEMQLRRRIRDGIESDTEKQQREFFLRKQLDSIRRELGDDDASIIEEFRSRIAGSSMPETVREHAERELARFERMGEQGTESQMIRTYLEWLTELPWGVTSQDRLDLHAARAQLDADHAGLDDVKQRIVEYLAVRKLRQERGIEMDPRSGAILTLVGPPGTGKTSIGESIAAALGRKYVRMALGGVRDEAEIRGHRRTYVGALPGRLVRALRDAGTMNPVIVLDEVDKLGADWRGDPSSALLEVLDPAQNHSFRDHYLDVELDLSKVFFIATANMIDQIPGPLLDRMEVIRFDGYTNDEKRTIAREHLLPRQRDRNGLTVDEIAVDDPALDTIIAEYTREAGVRNLERELGKVLRKVATGIATDELPTPVDIGVDRVRSSLGRRAFWQEAAERTAIPGVATGLAVTGSGGDVLFVEASSMPGEGFTLTGQLGDVMKESARIALTWVRSNAERLGIELDQVEGRHFHLHVPAGAIPKDGPSAGITMTTALVSLLTGRPVKHTVGMTGELTLQGKVLPIGGVKQKVLAAHAAGLTEVVLPDRNRGDLDELPADVRDTMQFHIAIRMDEVLDWALEDAVSRRFVASESSKTASVD